MDLVIKQNVNQQENGNSALLDLLYNLTKPDPITGQPSVDAVLVGRITVPAAYEDAVNFLNTQFSSEQDNGSDLQITVLNNNYYIRFEDPVVEEILRNSIGKGEGEGITVAEAATLNIGSLLNNNADIESFNEFKYFSKNNTNTAYQINNCGALSSIDLSECTNYPQRNFNNLPNLEYFHGPNSESGVLAFPEGTTSIPYLSFGNLPKLKHLIFPSTMRSVSEACHDCPNIETITLNPGFESFNGNSFNGSGNGKLIISDLNAFFNITWAPSNGWKNFFHKCPNFFLKDSNDDLTEITSVTIPQTMLAIPGAIFYVCKSLQNVVFHTGIISVGRGAFGWASNLVIPDLNLPNLTSLDNESFAGTKIQVISNLGSVTTIPQECFKDCSGLTSVAIPNSVTSIGKNAFSNCSSLTSLTIPNSVTSIVDYAFSGCTALTSVNIPSSVTNIGSRVFNGDDNLVRVDITDFEAFVNITYEQADSNPVRRAKHLYINGEESLVHYTFPQGTTIIKPWTLQGIYSLQHVTFPEGVTSIGEGLFFSNENLTTVDIPSTITTLGSYCFELCSNLVITDLNLPNLTTLGKNAFIGTKIQTVSNLGSITSIPQECFKDCSGLTSVAIPNSVTSIGKNAFSNCSSLTSLTIPNSVTSIVDYAFSGCSSLTSIEFPEGLTTISSGVCTACSALTTAVLPSTTTRILDITFSQCRNLQYLTVKALTPPTVAGNSLLSTHSNLVIYVPSSSVDTYKTASGWSTYSSRIQAIPE